MMVHTYYLIVYQARIYKLKIMQRSFRCRKNIVIPTSSQLIAYPAVLKTTLKSLQSFQNTQIGSVWVYL
jgi:hypothetical protein